MVQGQHQLSLPRAQPKLLFPFNVWWQFFYCKICQSRARQKCGLGGYFLAVPASWSSQHERVEGRGKERGSPRETRKAAGHWVEMGMDSLGRKVVPLPAAQRPRHGSRSGDGAGAAPTVLARSRRLGLNFTLREEPRELVRRATGAARAGRGGFPANPAAPGLLLALQPPVSSGCAAPSVLRQPAVC